MNSLLTVMLVLGAEPVRYELEAGQLKVPGPVVFAVNSAKLKDEGLAVLDFVKGYLEAKPYITLMRVEVPCSRHG